MTIAGDNIRRLRKAKGMSQQELADKAGISQQLISQLERGENERTLELPALARALEADIVQIDPDYVATAMSDPEAQLRAAALALGVDKDELNRVVDIVRTFIRKPVAVPQG